MGDLSCRGSTLNDATTMAAVESLKVNATSKFATLDVASLDVSHVTPAAAKASAAGKKSGSSGAASAGPAAGFEDAADAFVGTLLSELGGGPVGNSLELAERFGVDHQEVLVRALKTLGESSLAW